jgi:hypothetical protein
MIHQFVTPQVFKQGHQVWQPHHQKSSWSLKDILWILLLINWGKRDSETERFLAAGASFTSQRRFRQNAFLK